MPLAIDTLSAGPAAHAGRLAVIDIGSNSMRLVAYERLERAPVPIFNEKIMCGLGRMVDGGRMLNPEGVRLALDNLVRFQRLTEAMQIQQIEVLATAAVRDAADGPAFVQEVERRTGFQVRVIAGEEEARLAAMGVLSGAPGADGVVGDLGGGSLELVGLDAGAIGPQATTPLGALRLAEASGGKPGAATKIVSDHLSRLDWLERYTGRDFHPVGGSWRALAKLHMEQTRHPLHIIHNYAVDADELRDFLGVIEKMSRSSQEKLPGVSRRRLETLPYAALVLERVLKTMKASKVVFSAYGLREGILFDRLSPEERAQDPLISACTGVAERLGRFGAGSLMFNWMRPLFVADDPGMARLRQAACLLSDLGWPEHPDYRAELAFLRVLRMPSAGVDHAERAFLALASYVRYGGSPEDSVVAGVRTLLSAPLLAKAAVVGQALRLAHTLTGGAMGLLRRTALRVDADVLTLVLVEEDAVLVGDAVRRRLDSLARSMSRAGAIDYQHRPQAA